MAKVIGVVAVLTMSPVLVQNLAACAGCGCSGKKATAAKPQTVCPVMGGKINKEQYVDVNGRRVYVCCPACKAAIAKDPAKYLAKIAAKGETAERLPVTLCGGCGQIKGSDVCCKADAVKCGGCGLAKGSPGCCKIPKGKDVPLCLKCGQAKGAAVCCDAKAAKCAKCGLAKGSPGCCKLP